MGDDDALERRSVVAGAHGGVVPFARSWVLSLGPPAILSKSIGSFWVQRALGPAALWHDPCLEVRVAGDHDRGMALLGLAIDPDLTDQTDLIDRLSAAWRAGSLDDHLDRLNGRCVCAYWNADGFWLQSDAVAMRGIYWHAHEPVAGGNSRLVAEAVDDVRPSYYGQRETSPKVWTTPGRRTQMLNVWRLGPNVELELRGRTARRVGPVPHTPSTVDDAADKVRDEAGRFLDQLCRTERPIVASLTAGFDSRVTLALTRRTAERMSWFTYQLERPTMQADVDRDVTVATELAARFGLDHRVLDLSDSWPTKAQAAIFARNTHRQHGRQVSVKYAATFPLDAIHVRSNLYELGRFYYGAFPIDAPIAEWMATRLLKGRSVDASVIADYSDQLHFSDYAAVPEEYAVQDMFYWETRLGGWMQNMLIESDVAFDTVIPINSRRIIRTLLSVPTKQRAEWETFHAIIRGAWPEVLEHPINGRRI